MADEVLREAGDLVEEIVGSSLSATNLVSVRVRPVANREGERVTWFEGSSGGDDR